MICNADEETLRAAQCDDDEIAVHLELHTEGRCPQHGDNDYRDNDFREYVRRLNERRGERKPQVVLGIELAEALPDGWQPQGVIVLVRALDADGRRRITHLEGGDVMLWEGKSMIDLAARDFGARLDALNECVEHGPIA
jgi:hypothetical protein